MLGQGNSQQRHPTSHPPNLPRRVESSETSRRDGVVLQSSREAPPLPTAINTPTVTSTSPTAPGGPIIIPHGSQPSMTVAYSTGAKVVYPRAPSVQEGQNLFRCPCCYLSLPMSFSAGAKWRSAQPFPAVSSSPAMDETHLNRKRLAEDIFPHTCVLPSVNGH